MDDSESFLSNSEYGPMVINFFMLISAGHEIKLLINFEIAKA